MTTIMDRLSDSWSQIADKYSDPRVKDWPLMQSPLPTMAIVFAYVVFVKRIGPQMMKHRKPYEMRSAIIAYNLFQVILSTYIFYNGAVHGWLSTYSWRCEPLNRSTTGSPMQICFISYVYYLSKFTELLDTLFFILRKKFNQVSTLHVIHHGIMPFSVWWGIKFSPGGHASFFGFLNSGVHIVMYMYYLLAAFGPGMQKYLWWKKYLTLMQMTQFVMVFVHGVQLIFSNPCGYSEILSYVVLAHAIMFFYLFREFYKSTYDSKQKAKSVKSEQSEETYKEAAGGKQVETVYYASANKGFKTE